MSQGARSPQCAGWYAVCINWFRFIGGKYGYALLMLSWLSNQCDIGLTVFFAVNTNATCVDSYCFLKTTLVHAHDKR